MDVWGHHLMLEAAGCNERLGDADAIKAFARDLVGAIGMTAYGEPIVAHFGHGDPDTCGYTLVQLIETSNITAHFCDNRGEIYLDVFSCRDFDAAEVERVFRRHFAPQAVSVQKIGRMAPALAAEAAGARRLSA
jgi:S-adenosylmethionine decarboxylase